MSIVGLRVDTCDYDSPSTLISHCLCNRESLITLLLCLQRTHIQLSRDLRRLIAIYCTVPTPTIMPGIIPHDYYTHYLTHPATRKYNPILHCVSDTSGAIFLMIHIEADDSILCDFGHPFPDMLRTQPAVAETCWTRLADTPPDWKPIVTAPNTYSYRVQLYGDMIIGMEYDRRITSATVTTGNARIPLTSEPLNIRSYHIPANSPKANETLITRRDRLNRAYCSDYNPILRFSEFIRTNPASHYEMEIVSSEPLDKVGVVYLFLPPELLFM